MEKEIKDYEFQKFFMDINGSTHDKAKTMIKIMKKNCFGSDETVYVGDMTHDVKAGKKAKVITIAVSWGYQSREKLLKESPNFLIDDLKELKKLI